MGKGQLAEKVGVRPSTVTAWVAEEGFSLPKGEQLIQLPEVLNVRADWLLIGSGPMRPVSDEDAMRLEIIGKIATRDGGVRLRDLERLVDVTRRLEPAGDGST